MNGKPRKWFRFRIATMLALFLVLFCALVFRAFHLQIMTGKTYKTLAEKQHKKTLQLYPERGIIYDRNGEKLAASILADSVFADPSKIDDVDEAAAQLASVTGQPKKAIAQQIAKSKNFCWVARMITPAQSEQIKNLKMEGVYLIQEPKRFYPNRELAGQLVQQGGDHLAGPAPGSPEIHYGDALGHFALEIGVVDVLDEIGHGIPRKRPCRLQGRGNSPVAELALHWAMVKMLM